jgi:hypothetical protein
MSAQDYSVLWLAIVAVAWMIHFYYGRPGTVPSIVDVPLSSKK